MRILFISYWSISDPLTTATILPSLRVLSSLEKVDRLIVATPELRNERMIPGPEISLPKTQFIPIKVKSEKNAFGAILFSFQNYKKHLILLAKELGITHILARSALAGSLAFKISRKLDIPFYVESFEPHSRYMLENRVWHTVDPRFLFQNQLERKIKKYARGILPVSQAYYRDLVNDGVPIERMKVMPCTIDLKRYDLAQRQKARELYGFANTDIVGIYIGKFDGIYLTDKAFDILAIAHNYFSDYKTVILTDYSVRLLSKALERRGISLGTFSIKSVSYEEVPDYLVAADLAYCFVRPHRYSYACSPIKNGEYWAAGLPILIPENIGDDSDIINKEGGGAVFDTNDNASVIRALDRIKGIINDPGHKQRIRGLAERYRSPELIEEAYRFFFSTSSKV